MALKVKRFALVLGALCAVFLAVVFVSAVLHGFSRAASWEISQRAGVDARDHNAIKHAYASAEMYSLIRLAAGPDCAAAAVIALGEWNERAERVVKRTTDWSPEVYKDLRNNLAGIAAAEWLYQETGYASPLTRLRLIGKLAQDDLIVAAYDDPRIPALPSAPDTGTALAKMHGDQAALSRDLAAAIAAHGDALRTDLGLK